MMKKLCLFVFCYFCLIMPMKAKDFSFIEGLEDIPLMDGLEQNTEKTVSFGNEESRFVEVSLTSSKVGFKKIAAFYKESLPQMGWTYQGLVDDTLIFYRDSESLNIHKEKEKPLKIHITVKNRI